MTSPEKIWAVTGYIGPRDMRGEWATDPAKILGGITEYTRTDITQAAIAAAMMGAADELLAFRGPIDVPRTDKAIVQDDAIDRCIEILKDHIPTDATTALNTLLAEAEKRGRDQALEEAAVKINQYVGQYA